MIFDIIELITFAFALIAFVFILIAYFKTVQKKSKKLIGGFLLVSGFILLNRVFTNIEVLFFKEFFNLLEHLSVVLAALVFVFVSWLTYKGGIK